MKKKYLAIIPARGGSKRLPRKNLLPLQSKPLILWTIESALQSNYIDDVCVTSDDDEILTIANNTGCLSIQRPSYLASDTATTFEAVKHAVEALQDNYEYIVLLQPTSPLRTFQHIDEAIQLLHTKQANAVVSVCETEHSPLWCNTLQQDKSLVGFLPKTAEIRSQDLPTHYRINGAIYICRTDKLLAEKSFFISENIFAYIMEIQNSVDIDNQVDFYMAESVLCNRQ